MSDEDTIARGYPPEAERTIAVDYDGVLFPFGYLWQEPEPKMGAVPAMRRLKARGYRLLIYTSRLAPSWLKSTGYDEAEMREHIARSLDRYGIPFDGLTGEKPPAMYYIDDRAIRFRDGEWPAIVDFILLAEANEPA